MLLTVYLKFKNETESKNILKNKHKFWFELIIILFKKIKR